MAKLGFTIMSVIATAVAVTSCGANKDGLLTTAADFIDPRPVPAAPLVPEQKQKQQ